MVIDDEAAQKWYAEKAVETTTISPGVLSYSPVAKAAGKYLAGKLW